MLKRLMILFLCPFSFLLNGDDNTNAPLQKFWVFFSDKGGEFVNEMCRNNPTETLGITARSIQRRSKVRYESNLVDGSDLPIYDGYLRLLRERGFEPIVASRWLNAVSLRVAPDRIDELRRLSFVRNITTVATALMEDPPVQDKTVSMKKLYETHAFDYGQSITQNEMIHVPEVHDLGINGEGVLVGMIDTGFDHDGRGVFSHLTIVDEYDFHWGDDDTSNEEGVDPEIQHYHGTETFSVLAGFDEGHLIGPAYGADYLLAKTEWEMSETRIEEDHWVAAIEWMESLGADIVTSSVGYTDFDDGFSYSYDDLDGQTCVTTIAAEIAVSKGVVVLNSAGNERHLPWHYIASPADGVNVIAVGAVTSDNTLTYFSSVGPTSDGRIKPDVVALGMSVVTVNPANEGIDTYTQKNGTSFAVPLVAGVCAMVLQARPELKPYDVREAIRETADRAQSYDNRYGWGLVHAYNAVFYHGMIFRHFETFTQAGDGTVTLNIEVLSNTGIEPDSVFLYYRPDGDSFFSSLQMKQLAGIDSDQFQVVFPSGLALENLSFYLTAVDASGIRHTGPVGAPNKTYTLTGTIKEIPDMSGRFDLHQNYPNPFNPRRDGETSIDFILKERSHVTLGIYNIVGQKVITLIDEILEMGEYIDLVKWSGRNDTGQLTASGLYFCRMSSGGKNQVCKIVLIR